MVLALLLAAAASPHLPMPRLFGDWVVSCDNAAVCAASSLAPEDGGGEGLPVWIVAIRRAPGPGARPDLAIQPYDDLAGPVTLAIDGKPALRFGKDGKLAGADPLEAAARLAEAKAIAVNDDRGKTVARISPKGASAALRFIDSAQHRDGTLGAMVAVGARPAASVPGPPPLPRIATPPASALPPAKLSRAAMDVARKGHDCSPPSEMPESFVPEFYRLDAATTLGILPCSTAAYQGDAVVVLVDNRGSVRPARFAPQFVDQGDPADPSDTLVDPEWDPARRALWTAILGRGAGDCGQSLAYVWDGNGFALAYAEVMEPCRGSLERLPAWRTTNVSAPQH